MKEKIFAIAVIIIVISYVSLNTIKLHSNIDMITKAVASAEISDSNIEAALNDITEAFDLFKKKELFLGLTVNHDDLSNIESDFAEMIGYLSVGDADGAKVTKSRLTDTLGHLRRLSGFNIDAII